jgi:hypothetical protein
MKTFGYIPDAPSDKDWRFEAIRPKMQPKFSGNDVIIPVTRTHRTQVGSTCVTNALLRAAEIRSDLENKPLPDLSAQDLYFKSRLLHDATERDEGTHIRCAADAWRGTGVCENALWPDNYATINSKPSGVKTWMDAFDRVAKIDAHYRISSFGASYLSDIDTAIRALHPPVVGLALGQEFVDYRGGGHVFSPPNRIVGYHAMIITGVRYVHSGPEFLLFNSWGADWGDSGNVWISSGYMSTGMDTWVVTTPF